MLVPSVQVSTTASSPSLSCDTSGISMFVNCAGRVRNSRLESWNARSFAETVAVFSPIRGTSLESAAGIYISLSWSSSA